MIDPQTAGILYAAMIVSALFVGCVVIECCLRRVCRKFADENKARMGSTVDSDW